MELVQETINKDELLKAKFVSGNFLQSSIWKDFLDAQRKRNWQLFIKEGKKIIGTCLIYENKLPMGKSYLYSPKGPLFFVELNDDKRQEAMFLILSKAREITVQTSKYQEIFYTLETNNVKNLIPELKKSHDVQPRDTWILNIEKDSKDLLADMHTKHRYNIALAGRKKVKVEFSTKEGDIYKFLELNKKTALKNKIQIHSDEHYKLLWKILLKSNSGTLCLASIDEQVIAANMMINFGEASTYLHGAADYKYRKYMAPHLLQWESIKKAKEGGYKIYDFWGVAPGDGSKPKWAGFSRFKKGFGGELIESPGAHNFIYNQTWYDIYLGLSKLKKIIRR